MKRFFEVFIIILILYYIFLFFGGAFIFENIWALLIVASFLSAVLMTVLMHQEAKIGKLEKRITSLESEKESRE